VRPAVSYLAAGKVPAAPDANRQWMQPAWDSHARLPGGAH
jgi:hypothetical protein